MCKTLINRAKTIYEVSNIGCELEHLRSVLKINAHPTKFIDNAVKTPRSIREKTEYQSFAVNSNTTGTITWPPSLKPN